ncbi:MAG: excinuclease ABC subunit C [Bacteroidales bacterium]|nr:excinuclease ABC subunit C [Bacteroidales bacterium]
MIDAHINPHIDHLLLRLKTIPENPGVYQYFNRDGTVIYVGKARNLHRRVSSYFNHYDEHSAKIKMLVRNICDVKVTVVRTEVDALLLENNLIKQYKPKYNSMLKDDKSYPYLCLTQEDFPKLLFTRNRESVRGHFFGPYPNGRMLRELQEIVRKLYPYRKCNHHFTEQSVAQRPLRPCINHQIGLCPAPCAGLISKHDYGQLVQQIEKLLKGDFGETLTEMKQQMFGLADELRFEEAEAMRRKIRLLEEYQSHSTVVGTSVHDVDVFSIMSDSRYAYLNMMRIKQGNIVYSFNYEIKKQLDESDEELLAVVIPQLHEQTESTAHEVIVPFHVVDLPDDYLTQTVPARGDKLQLLELSERNVKAYRLQCTHQRTLVDPDGGRQQLLERLQQALGLPRLPTNIECFDNSNIQGAFPVAAMVRFTSGRPNKAEYRKFNIKTVEGPDDYASMAEVIHRRYSRLHDEGKPLPDLLIVDGGKGQMEVARQVIEEQLHLDIPIAGLAKDDKHHTSELLYGFPPRTVGLRPTDPLFHLLEQIQNEVHRFAITFHRDKRSKGTIRTQLTDIPGIGPKTARDLLLKYGSVKALRLQSEEDLAKAIGPAKAKAIADFFRQTESI